jgi:hypothetical protein
MVLSPRPLLDMEQVPLTATLVERVPDLFMSAVPLRFPKPSDVMTPVKSLFASTSVSRNEKPKFPLRLELLYVPLVWGRNCPAKTRLGERET